MVLLTAAVNMPLGKRTTLPIRHRNHHYRHQAPKEICTSKFFGNSETNGLFNDMSVILLIMKAIGLLPIYKRISTFEIGPPTKLNDFYSFSIRGLIHSLTIFNLYYMFSTGFVDIFYSDRDMDNITNWIEFIFSILSFTAMLILCARNSKNFLNVINEILKVDQEILKQFGVSPPNKCGFTVKFTIVLFICQLYIIVIEILSLIDSEYFSTSVCVLIVFYALENGLCVTFIIFTSALLRIVTSRFAYLNLVMANYTYKQKRIMFRETHIRRRTTIPWGSSTRSSGDNFAEDALLAFRLHNKLLRIYKMINKCCSLILVGFMGYSFYSITTTTYNLFVEITTQREVSLSSIQIGFVLLIMYTSLLAVLTSSCSSATKEANRTSQILARVYEKDKVSQNIIDKFLTKSIKQEVEFTAYGFFVIDNSTLFKIFSAVTTYLVILIQFKQLEDSKVKDELLEV